ncbi:MAG TPA: hypothetical protein VGC41_21710 [Kofleriaceae bacterium]
MANMKAMLLGSWLGDKLMRDCNIAAISDHGAFRRIKLTGLAQAPQPGDKIQIYVPELGARTYSPFGWDHGAFEIVALNRNGFIGGMKVGDRVRFIGPQTSTKIADLIGPVALFGDETSFGVAKSLWDSRRGDAPLRLEVEDIAACEPMLEALGLPKDSLRPRNDLAAIARDLHAANASLVLTGNARSIQALRDQLKQLGNTKPQRVKGYWAEGKRGID